MTIDVCAAVIVRGHYFLLAQRPEGKHLAGKWEFPGGKVDPNESLHDCIAREILEELGLDVLNPRLLVSLEHDYPEKRIRLHFLQCAIADDAAPCHHEGQDSAWVNIQELSSQDLAPADRRFVEWLTDNPLCFTSNQETERTCTPTNPDRPH
jgi:mutator protein MutT